jgi:hypothetical protein
MARYSKLVRRPQVSAEEKTGTSTIKLAKPQRDAISGSRPAHIFCALSETKKRHDHVLIPENLTVQRHAMETAIISQSIWDISSVAMRRFGRRDEPNHGNGGEVNLWYMKRTPEQQKRAVEPQNRVPPCTQMCRINIPSSTQSAQPPHRGMFRNSN